MKIVLGFEGEESQTLACQLESWLPCVVQTIQPILEPVNRALNRDFTLNSIWRDCDMTILCLSKGNHHNQWFSFLTGALLAMNTPMLLIGYNTPTAYGPLNILPVRNPDKKNMAGLVHWVNAHLGSAALKEEQLNKTFETWWPKFKRSGKTESGLGPSKEERHAILQDLRHILDEYDFTVDDLRIFGKS